MSAYPLEKWDADIAPYLHTVQSHAHYLSYHGRGVIAGISMLPARPQWPTMMEEALDEAEKELKAALALVEEAKRKYQEVSIILEAAE